MSEFKLSLKKAMSVSASFFILLVGVSWMSLQSAAVGDDYRVMMILTVTAANLMLSIIFGLIAGIVCYIREKQLDITWFKVGAVTFGVGFVFSLIAASEAEGSSKHQDDVFLFGLFLSAFAAVIASIVVIKRLWEKVIIEPEEVENVGGLLRACHGDSAMAKRLIEFEKAKAPLISDQEAENRAFARLERDRR